MPEFWRAADVGVVPSNGLVESFGMSAVEAMACGKPVIVTDSGALPELVVAGQTGKVVPAGDVSGLARALMEYAVNPEMRQDHGRNGRRRCQEEFGIGHAAERYLELCADVCAIPATPRSSSEPPSTKSR
jgi:glycosyltransferase involved in cell wall biosynthesis